MKDRNAHPDNDFWSIIHSARRFVLALSNSGFKLISPDDGSAQHEQMIALVRALVSDEHGSSSVELIRKGAEGHCQVVARIERPNG